MQNTEDRKWLYDRLKSEGYDIGTQEEFESSLNNEDDAKWYYEKASGIGLDVGTYDDFNAIFRSNPEADNQEPSTPIIPEQKERVKMTYHSPQFNPQPIARQKPQPKDNTPTKPKPDFGLNSGIPSIAETTKAMIEGRINPVSYTQPQEPETITTFGEGVKQGTEQLYAGAEYGMGEALAPIVGTNRDDIDALAEIERLQAEGKDVAEETKNVTDLSTVSPIVKKGLELMGAGKAIGDAEKITQRNRTIQKALKESGGDVEKAKLWLGVQAAKKTKADELMADAQRRMAEAKPTKGWGWVGSMIPQMVGTGVGLVASAVFKSPLPAQVLGGVNMGVLTASTAGQAMAEARQAGASNSQVWGAGIVNGAIELLTEKIPFDRYTSKIVNAAKRQAGKTLADAASEVGSPANRELQDLLTRANKELDGRLFSGKNVREYLGDVVAEGLSEAAAEGLQTIVPIMYESPENYPTLLEIIGNAVEGAKGGLFMGTFLGGASKAAEHRANRARRKQQGFVDVAEVIDADNNSYVVEVVRDENDQEVFFWDGKKIPILDMEVKQRHAYSFDDFERAQIELEQDEAYENGRTLETPQEKNDAVNMLEIQEANVRRYYGAMDDTDVDALLGENPMQTALDELAKDEEGGQTILDYLNAKASINGVIGAAQDRIEQAAIDAGAIIDSRKSNTDGLIHPAKMKLNDRQLYIISGNVAQLDDGTIDTQNSDESIIIMDAATGKREFATAKDLLNIDEALDPEAEKATVRETIAETISTEVDNQMRGVLPFNVGDTYTIMGDDGTQHTAQVVAVDDENVVQVIMDNETQPTTVTKDIIQQMSNAYNLNRAAQFEQGRQEQREAEKLQQEADQAVEPTNMVEQTPETPTKVIPERVVPTLKDGNPDFNAMEPDMFVEEYVSRYGEDSAVKIARKNISTARENVAKIDKKIDDITDPNQMEGLYAQRKSAEAQIARYSNILERLGASEDVNESEDDQRRRLRNDAGNRIATLFPDGMPNVESFILADIATGNRIRWSDKVTNGAVTSRGLGAELGLSESAKERTRRLPLIGKDAMTPEEYAESLRERLDAVGIRYDETSLRDAVLSVYQNVDSRKGAWDALENMSKNMQEPQTDMDWEDMQQQMAYNKAMQTEDESQTQGVETELPDLETYEEETTITEGEYAEMVAEKQAEEQKDYDAMMAEYQPVEEASTLQDAMKEEGSQNNGNLFKYYTGSLSELISQAKQTTQGLFKKILAPVSSRLKRDLEAKGILIGDDYKHVIDNSAIRHTLNEHSKDSEYTRGQIPITESDFDNIPDVVENYDNVEVVVGKRNETKIIYSKTYADGTTIFVEEKRNKRKELAAVTMWKIKNPTLTDANRNATQISDLSKISESKDTTSKPQKQEVDEKISQEEQKVNVNPTDGQKEAGNYKKGHVVVDGFNITIEQPKGSVRSGVDADGKEWSITMNNTYGYIRGTEGVDGDHIDVFLSDNLDNWSGEVFVVDQINIDGSFDEHKVMYGFNSIEEAQQAYLSNYSEGWQGLGAITGVSKDEFKKWIASSHRKTKPFAEYKSVKATEGQSAESVEATDDEQILFRRGEKSGQEGVNSLVGVHNISLDKLKKAIKMGGLANPSVAIIDIDRNDHTDYGDYSLVLSKNMVDARLGKNAGTWAGDAWTPTYPQVTKRMSKGKDISRFYKDISAMPEAIRGRVRLDFDSFMDGRSANALAYWYLFEKGNAPEFVYVPARYSEEIVNAINEATNGSFSMYDLSAENRIKCVDAYIAYKYGGDRAAYDAEMDARKNRLESFAKSHEKAFIRKKAQEDLDDINEYGFDYDEVSRFIHDVESDVHHKGKVDVNATIKASIDYITENNLGAEYDAWRDNLDERYGIKEYIFDGYTNSGTPRYLPHTIENASKWMKKQGRQGAVATFPSFGTFVAVSIPKMTTLDSIRKRKNSLGKSKEEYDAFREKWENVYYELGKKLQPDAKGFDDYGYWRLIEAVGQRNPKEYIKKQYNIELSKEDMNTLNEMLDAIRNEYPARYFETKFERPINIREFVGAVVPNNIPSDVEAQLLNAGVNVYKYNPQEEGSRREAMLEAVDSDSIRFRTAKSNFDSQFANLQSEYDALDKNDAEALNAWRDKKADVVRSYVNWVLDKFGLKCELYVFNGSREEEMRKVYDTMVEKYKANGIENIPSYESFKEKVTNPKVVATHRKRINFVTFNTSADDAELDIDQFAETLFHENAHRIAQGMYSKQEFEQIWENAKKSKNRIAKSVEKLYSGKNDAQKGNEFIAKAIGELVRNHKQLFTKFLMDKGDISADDLVKKLKYSLPLGKLALTETLNEFRNEYRERVLQGSGSSILGGSRDGGDFEVSEGDGGRNSRGNRKGESRRLRAERGRDVVKAATDLASSLGVKLNVIEDVNEITDSNARRQRAKRGAKAWYDVNTDQVYFVAPNATSIADAQESVLHEVVAHKGLRDVVGRENFNRFLDKVFQSAAPEIRTQIVSLAAQNRWDFRVATEEYLASLAEEGFDSRENRTFWQKVRDLFMDMLHEAKIALGYNINDNDMRYMLWRTYQMQRSQGAMAVAEDIVMQQKMGVGDFRARPMTEEEQIIADAKANGAYLKAPNGKKSNLTPKQWAQVRTKAFKNWFGDWEKAARIEKLRKSKDAKITGSEIEASEDLKQYRKNAQEYGKTLRGEYVNADTGNSIILNKDSLKEVLHHDGSNIAHIQSIAAIPQMIENGIYITSESVEENASKRMRNAKSVHYYVCGLKIGNTPYTVKFVIAEYANGDRYYDHSLTQIEKGDLLNRAELSSTVAESKSPISDIKDKRLISILQTNSSKVVDANGEPKVVEHSTWNDDFYTFDIDRLGESSGDEGVYGAGFYFGNVGHTELYGDRTMQVYLNANNPLILPEYSIMKFFDYIVDNFDKQGLRGIIIKQGNKSTTLGEIIDAIKEVQANHRNGEYYELIESMKQYWTPSSAEDRVIEQTIFRKVGFAFYRSLESFIDNNIGRRAFSEGLRNAGYDGVVFNNQEYVVFDPNQIKSATDNIGTFDPSNDDIRFRSTEITEEERVNARFNEELGRFNEDTKDKINLSLGMPSDILKAVGVENKPIKLYGAKLFAKAQKHGYNVAELRDLPLKVANPIAIFKGSHEGSFAILTEINIAGNNVLATLSVGKGGEDIDFNIISSVYDKQRGSVGRWINNGKLLYVNKEKTLNYLHHSAPIAEALSNPELSSGAKIIENFVNPTIEDTKNEPNGDILFRSDRPEPPAQGVARDMYDRAVRKRMEDKNNVGRFENLWHHLVESYQDSMLAVNDLYKAILAETGKKLHSFEDVYKAENRLSSTNKAQIEAWERDFMKPLQNVIMSLIDNGTTYNDIIEYILAKSGIERNRVLAERDAEEATNRWEEKRLKGAERAFRYEEKRINGTYGGNLAALHKSLDTGAISQQEYDTKAAELEVQRNNKLGEVLKKYERLKKKIQADRSEMYLKAWEKNRDKDYSGLTELTGEKQDFNIAAQDIVDAFEDKHETAPLWDAINAATKETLRKSYDSGMMNKETFDKVSTMFKYYVPLRGWDNNVAADHYEYMSDKGMRILPALKTAKGRTSRADDPIATIGSMGESSIIQGNRNIMKQQLLNFAQNNPTSLLTVGEQWYVKMPDGTWVEHNPVIPENATGDEVDAIIKQHEADMKALGEDATKSRNKLNLGMHATSWEGQEHVINVKRNGKVYQIFVNGNPIAAQAINGFTNPNAKESWLSKAASAIKNFMARVFTSQNPAFIVDNLRRDVIWAGTSVAIKENPAYAKQYAKNIMNAFGRATLPRLVYKWKKGTLNMSNTTERYFHEFITNGGETGFTQLNTVDDYKRNMQRFIKEAQGGAATTAKKAWRGFWEGVEFLNRSAEDTTRFMVYITSRQMGRSISESISNAKDVTVNFNKKGRGEYGASMMNYLYIFFNATIQSLANFGKLIKNHPAKAMAAISTYTAAGFILPLAINALQTMFGDDDEEKNPYWDLPEWVRRNNIVLGAGGVYVTIPLPHELRPFYGLGEIAYSVLSGKEPVEYGLKKASEGFAALLPFDFTGNGSNAVINFTPTIAQPLVQVHYNTDYFGTPIYRKTAFNEKDPEWTKAYKSTNAMAVDAAEFINYITGGDIVKKGAIDINPAVVEHIVEAYLGGLGKTLNRTAKSLSMIWDEDMREVRNVPILNSFIQVSDERSTGSQLNREYFNALDEFENTKHLLQGYKKQKKMGAMEYAEKLDDLMKSPIYKRYEIIKGRKKAISELNKQLQMADPADREDVETKIMNLKVSMLDALNAVDDNPMNTDTSNK